MGLSRATLTFTVVLMTAVVARSFAAQAATQPRSRPRGPTKEQRSFARALEAFDKEDYLLSRYILDGLLRAHPRNALYWFNLGNAQIKLKEYRLAMRSYERVVKLRSPLSGIAGIYLSKAARAQGNLETSLEWMRWVSKRSLPPNIEQLAHDEATYVQVGLMARAMIAYDANQYPKAIADFEKVLSVEGDPQVAGQADMMKGLSLLKEDQKDQAQAEFEAVMKRESTNGVQEYAHYLSRLNQQATVLDPSYWLSSDFALSYNSNLFGDGNSVSATDAAVIPYFLGGGVRAFRSGLYSLIVGDSLSGEEPIGLPSERIVNNSFWTLLKYQTTGWLIQFANQLDYTILGIEPFSLKPTFSASAQRVYDRERVGLTFSASYLISESDQFNYIQGNSFALRAFWIHHGLGWTGGPFLFVARENSAPLQLTAGTLPLGYTGFGPGFSGYLAPIHGWELSGSTSLSFRNYYDLAEPGDLPRNDYAVSIFLRGAKRITREFALYISVDSTVNSSSLGVNSPEDKNYSQVVVATGVSWDLL